ncbi:two component transcriptional regulator, LytTR family [Aquiflexum balticum DSM 16537]|uniref:Two component transcriptional regulator, LytTR family n=1 Tax=Aquiflexum balticum DSM 16537 TaxID=758820 RepID=A0A1W2H8I8_9BACT|nr:LytTR family DNA-binding domain-containing protein [Aquiflexum balticum]SMD45179.1 two component transcriptional regulator, LytTR family [Aquiflexum balticum DSM 16537]
MKIKTIIVEDEPLAREGLKSYIREIDFLDLVGSCENALEANNIISSENPELMFLDIQMPKITGLDFLKSLKKPPMVIFTTAYPNYALQGFELDVIDYLVKPYSFDRFLKAVNKAREMFQLKNQKPFEENFKDHIFLKVDNILKRINFEEILYIEGMENYIAVHTHEGRFITLMTMKNMEELLPSRDFLRVHKTYIISRAKVKGIVGNEIDMGMKKIPFSRSRRNEIIEALVGG